MDEETVPKTVAGKTVQSSILWPSAKRTGCRSGTRRRIANPLLVGSSPTRCSRAYRSTVRTLASRASHRGSNPRTPANFSRSVAQMEERHVEGVRVGVSKPPGAANAVVFPYGAGAACRAVALRRSGGSIPSHGTIAPLRCRNRRAMSPPSLRVLRRFRSRSRSGAAGPTESRRAHRCATCSLS